MQQIVQVFYAITHTITIKTSRNRFFNFWHWIPNSKVIVFQNQNATKLVGVSYNHPLLVSISNVLQTLF